MTPYYTDQKGTKYKDRKKYHYRDAFQTIVKDGDNSQSQTNSRRNCTQDNSRYLRFTHGSLEYMMNLVICQ